MLVFFFAFSDMSTVYCLPGILRGQIQGQVSVYLVYVWFVVPTMDIPTDIIQGLGIPGFNPSSTNHILANISVVYWPKLTKMDGPKCSWAKMDQNTCCSLAKNTCCSLAGQFHDQGPLAWLPGRQSSQQWQPSSLRCLVLPSPKNQSQSMTI